MQYITSYFRWCAKLPTQTDVTKNVWLLSDDVMQPFIKYSMLFWYNRTINDIEEKPENLTILERTIAL